MSAGFFGLSFNVVAEESSSEYSFDMSAYEKSPYSFGGYFELRWEHLNLNQEAALYELSEYQAQALNKNDTYAAALQFESRFQGENWMLYARFNPESYQNELRTESVFNTHELYASWKANSSFSVDAGKKLLKWGKGYAWNPVGFVERAKDPNDPDLAREGYGVLTADWINSRSGDLRTLTLSPVYLPVREDLNSDFGSEHNNTAIKLYMLYKDTDIDFMYLANGSFTPRFGFDFSKNLLTNFEVHGEWARITNFAEKSLDAFGVVSSNIHDANKWLLGFRYLNALDTTFIAEYYFNGTGLDGDSMENFYALVDAIPQQADPATARAKALALAQSGFLKQSNMRQYLYLRIQQKDAYDILYFSPALTLIQNIEDHSYNLVPELLYTGITNLELRARANIIRGGDNSEFAEKQNSAKGEIRARYSF